MTKEKAFSPLAIALQYYEAWTNKNFDKAADCLSDNVVFETPVNSYASKEEFMKAVAFTAGSVSKTNLLAQFGNENEALLLYDMELNPLGNLRIAEYFKVENNKVIMIRHVHDTFELRKVGF